MDKTELTEWALKHGWQILKGELCLTKPSRPTESIVRLVFKTTVVNVEVKKPAGKWEKVSGAAYRDVTADAETGLPLGLGFETISGLTQLMQQNQDRIMIARTGGG